MTMAADHTGLDAHSSLPSRREVAGWLAAGLVVIAAHALAAGVYRKIQALDEPTAEIQAAMVVDLAPLPFVAPDAVESEIISEMPAPEVVTETIDGVDTLNEEIENTTAEQNVAESVVETPVEQVEPEQVSEITPDAVDPELLETELVEQVTPEVAIPLPAKRPEKVAEKPRTEPVRRNEKPKPVKKIADRQKEQRRQAATAPAASGAAAPSVSPAKWQAKVVAWINRHKPRSFRGRGVAQVGFQIDSSGNVLGADIIRSSGDDKLDQAAIKMVMRSSPVPAPPPEIARSRHSMSLPVEFKR